MTARDKTKKCRKCKRPLKLAGRQVCNRCLNKAVKSVVSEMKPADRKAFK